nr:CRE-ACIN-1 protein [Haemonchus contortus]
MQSVDEARNVRLAMHNTQWPVANPKTLSVQFDTKENLERHRTGTSSAASLSASAPSTRIERKLSDRERPVIGQLPGRNPSLKITVEAAVRENEKREETKERERRERARAEKHAESRRDKDKEEKSERVEERRHGEEKHASKKDDHGRKRQRSETPPFSRAALEKRERRDVLPPHDREKEHDRDPCRDRDRDRDHSRRRSNEDRARDRHQDTEKEKEREEKPVKTADQLFMKTKTLPAIYFLPLTDEEAQERQEKLLAEKRKREQKELEREKEREKEKSRH